MTAVEVLRARADRLWDELRGTTRLRERVAILRSLHLTYVEMARHERDARPAD